MIEVCFSPALLPYHTIQGKVVVIIDVLRATSVICSGLSNGVDAVIPVASLEEAEAYQNKGYVVAAERGGKIPSGFQLGNSPIAWRDAGLKGQTVILTTTNGTHAIEKSKAAEQVLIASFLNASAITKYLQTLEQDVILICAGWQNRYSLEDTTCAGMILDGLGDSMAFKDDESLTALDLYQMHAAELEQFLGKSAHAQRLSGLDHQNDFEFCLQVNRYEVIPVLENNRLVALNK